MRRTFVMDRHPRSAILIDELDTGPFKRSFNDAERCPARLARAGLQLMHRPNQRNKTSLCGEATGLYLIAARPSRLNAMSMPSTRRNVCARRRRPASARGFLGEEMPPLVRPAPARSRSAALPDHELRSAMISRTQAATRSASIMLWTAALRTTQWSLERSLMLSFRDQQLLTGTLFGVAVGYIVSFLRRQQGRVDHPVDS
jgi:hypothetical protein